MRKIPCQRLAPPRFHWAFALLSLAVACIAGCTTPPTLGETKSFRFPDDTLGLVNQTLWSYSEDASSGRWTHQRADPPPDYTHRCFTHVRVAKGFFAHARFEPEAAVLPEEAYGEILRRVVRRSPRRVSEEADRISIPGFANLREFSTAREDLFREELGGPWRSFLQRGNWRMLWPFSARHQERLAARLLEKASHAQPAAVHVMRFPALTINHALLVYQGEVRPKGYRFLAHDPNDPSCPVELSFNLETRRFELPRTAYFAGGRVDVNEVYRSLCH